MEINENSDKQNNIIGNGLINEGDPNKMEPSIQRNKVGGEEAPELEMREEVNASPLQDENDLQIIEKDKGQNDPLDEPVSNDEMRKIVLAQSQLKILSTSEPSTFRRIVIGCFIRVNIPGLPQNYSDRVFMDEIVDIIEPLSFQHLWVGRRYRLRFLGDFEIEQVVSLKVQNETDLRSWFDCMEAKGESIPTLRFVREKDEEIRKQMGRLAAKQDAERQKLTITRDNLAQIALNPSTLRSLSKLEFERFRKIVVGCFVLMPAIRKYKQKDCQYHIVRVIDCVEGPRNYKMKNLPKVNFQLILPFYGRYIIKWMKSFSTVTEQGFRSWVDDMRSWGEKLPTLEDIQNKAAELQLALTEAENLPSMMDLEKTRLDEEERSKRAKLPVRSAKDLEPCFLTRDQLQKLCSMEDSQALVKLLSGCFVRLTSSGASDSGFELDKIMNVKLNEHKKNGPAIVLELKFMGTVSLTALICLVSSSKMTEKEFQDWIKKNEGDQDDPLPLNEYVDEKGAELIKLLGLSSVSLKSQTSSVIGSNSLTTESKIKEENNELNESLQNKSQDSITKEPFSLTTKDGKLTSINFRKCLLSMNKICDMMSWDKETFARVIKGFYVRIGAKRREKSSKHQFYVDQITGVSWGGSTYRIRGNALTDLRLHFRNLDVKTLHQLYRSSGDGFDDDSLMIFGEDMKKWNQSLPTLNFIDSKNREYVNAVSKSYKLNAKNLLNQSGLREMSFLAHQDIGNSPNLNPNYEQLQQYIQKQVFSSVKTTPGMGQIVKDSPTPLFPSSKPSPLQYFSSPRADEGNWKQQAASFISPSVNKPQQLSDFRPEKESWRQQFSPNEFEMRNNDPYGAFAAKNPPTYSSNTDSKNLMSLRDLANASSSRPYQEGNFVGKLSNFGSPSSALQQFSYLHSKRRRLSPEAPPVERLF